MATYLPSSQVLMSVETEPKNIILGYRIASLDDGKVKGTIVASGSTIRVSLEGFNGHVDIDIHPAVIDAVSALRMAASESGIHFPE